MYIVNHFLKRYHQIKTISIFLYHSSNHSNPVTSFCNVITTTLHAQFSINCPHAVESSSFESYPLPSVSIDVNNDLSYPASSSVGETPESSSNFPQSAKVTLAAAGSASSFAAIDVAQAGVKLGKLGHAGSSVAF